MSRQLLVLAAILAVVPGVALSAGKAAPKKAATQSDVLATVGDWSLRMPEVDQELAGFIYDLEIQVYKQRMQVVQEGLSNHLLMLEAKATGSTPAALLEKEVISKVPEVTQEAVSSFMKENKERLPNKGEGLEERVKQLLKSNARETAYEEYMIQLGKKYKAVVNNPLPRVPIFNVDAPSDVGKGAADAPVTIVEFSDFECPYCKKAATTITELEKAYPGKVRFAYRHFPMPAHTNAMNAAEASLCAAEQKKFWEFHDMLFANTDKLGQSDLKGYAKKLGLDMGKFDQCQTSNRNVARVQKDTRDGVRQGVTGTPTFFINGHRLVGAQPLESYKKVIDAELKKKQK